MEIDAKKLLYLIEARRPIYNNTDKEYTNKVKTQKLWMEIATEMECPVAECRNKWLNLRSSYGRYLRNERLQPLTLSGKQIKKWHLADNMTFVKNYINNYSSSLDSPDVVDITDDISDDISEVDPLTTQNESTQAHTSPVRNSPMPAKMSRPLASEMVAGPMIDFLQSRTKRNSSENANTLFFKSLLADYEKLSSRNQRSFRLHMLSKMNELQEEEENAAFNASPAEAGLNVDYDIKEEFFSD